jgi:hypothetical protein
MPASRCRFSGDSRVFLLLVACLAAGACTRSPSQESQKAPSPSPGAAPTYGCTADGGTLQIQFPAGGPPTLCPSFPNTTPTAEPQWDYFAWNSFIAANWPALDPGSNNNQRGFPDLTKSFATAQPSDLLVWETFKEKRELFQPFFNPATNTYTEQSTVNPGPWNQALNYGPLDATTNQPYAFPACATGQQRLSAAQLRSSRRLPQLGKLAVDGNGSNGPDSLDETIEVASEALESPSALCQGYTTNPCGTSGPPDCSCVQSKEIGPRVWKGNPTQQNPQPVYYEVKINYDYYNYVQSNNFWIDANAQAAAPQGNLRLPFRTSAGQQPVNSPANVGVTGYDAQTCVNNVDKNVTSTSNLTPCLAGSIQVKTAWIPLTHGEDVTKYHTATAAVYRTQNDPQNPICLDASGVTYGLVGIHIIQRIHQGSGSGNSNPQGGTYIFATWEHVDNDKAGFTYANYFPPQVAALFQNPPPPPVGFYPMPANALPVQRQFQILPGTQTVNTTVWNAIKQINPNSVWLNYQLIGTQFIPINLPTETPAVPPFPTTLPSSDPMNIGQPTYLANLVIETNDGLQLFRGLPPSVQPIKQFVNSRSPQITGNSSATTYNRNTPNVAFNGGQGAVGFTMGGCMGCHGVAELKGYSFSFIFLEGQLGADVDTEDDFNVAPLAPAPPGAPRPFHLPPKVHKRAQARKPGS